MELIHISGQNLSIGQSLQEYARDRLNSIVNKYFDHAPSANIKFSKERGFFVCDVNSKRRYRSSYSNKS